MADQRYKVAQLFQAAFGMNSPVFITQPFKKDAPANLSFKGLETVTDTLAEYGEMPLGWMGTPIVFPAYFNKGNYQRFKANGQLERIDLEQFRFPPATMFSFRQAKNITTTNVLGKSGTVKEIYGFDDWIIDVKGLCLDEPMNSAKTQLEKLLKFNSLADGIGISGALFEQLEISRICMMDWSHNIVQGKQGVLSFQFMMRSDEDLDLVTGNTKI